MPRVVRTGLKGLGSQCLPRLKTRFTEKGSKGMMDGKKECIVFLELAGMPATTLYFGRQDALGFDLLGGWG